MAEKTHQDIVKIANYLIERDRKLREAQEDYERMSRLSYKLPAALRNLEWVRPIITTKPYDALRGAVRAFANLNERLYINPVTCLDQAGVDSDESIAAIEMANKWEKALQWAQEKAARRKAAFRSSIMYSSVLYHEIIGYLIHLPTEFKIIDIGQARENAALRYGDWASRVVHPKMAHIDYSDYMAERALFASVRTAEQIVQLRGDRAREIRGKIENDPAHASAEYVEFNYIDYDCQHIWAVEGNVESVIEEEGIEILEPRPWMEIDGKPAPFLPVIAAAGGIDFEDAPEHKRKPLLYSVRQAELWAIANIMGTINYSKALAEANAPIHVFKGADRTRVDHTEPGGRLDLPPGPFSEYHRIQNYGLEPSMMQSFDRLEQAINSTTLSEILVTGLPMGGVEAYAAYNLQVQTALASLGDFKEVAERFYDAYYERMLLIAHYTGNDIVGYEVDREKKKIKKYVIDANKINPRAIYLKTELTPDVPVDRVQRVTAARVMSEVLNYSPQRIYKFLGDSDPEGAFREWKRWQLDLANFSGKLERMRAEASGQYERDVIEMAQQIVQNNLAQQQVNIGGGDGAGQLPPEFEIMQEQFGAEQGPMEGMESTMTPPIEASPEGATYEGATGRDRLGNQAAEIPGAP